MSVLRSLGLLVAWSLLMAPGLVQAQSNGDDASWYDPDAPYVQIDVTADGVYRVSGDALRSALPDGASLSTIAPESIRLLEKGDEIPIQLSGVDDGNLDGDDTLTFVGRRNRGTDEGWAYNFDRSAQSSTYYSLYSDTTTYWMTWGGEDGLRYTNEDPDPSSSPTSALRDTVHAEQDNRYYFGRPGDNGEPLYTESEGYYWRQFTHNDRGTLTFTHTLPVGRRTPTSTEMDLTVRLDGATNSCHRVELAAELRQDNGSLAFESLRTVEWNGTTRRTLTASVPQDDVPDGGLTLRLTSYNQNFADTDCDTSKPNYVLLDWMEAAYTRSLTATSNAQRFVAPTAGEQSFSLTGYTSSPVHVYNPTDARRYAVPVTNGTAPFSDAPSTASTPYWAVGNDAFRTPAALRPDTPSNPDNGTLNDWTDSDTTDADNLSADYLILTTEALRPSAQNLAEYRRSHDGYEVEVALVQNVFDEFDYGRPTPIAIRRFVRATQNWEGNTPDFLTIFGDAQYPIRDGSVSTLYPEWSVPSFGYAPSDGWYAMQTEGREDWSEVLAVGRIPVRSVAQGDLFVDKLRDYESAPLERWQKRMLLLAGGTSESEQESLQRFSNWWGEIAADTLIDNRSYSGSGYTGMDTLRYYKNVNDALDASFQDSLAVDLRQGSGWLNYFGHSAAQTWEIVTDPPSEFDNAGRLPIVVSLGCRTGSFAGGRFEEKDAPSLGEQLVVGSVRPDGTPRNGALNGGIAHFGESALGNQRPSARINDALIRRVFVDTVRVLGEAIRAAKDTVNSNFGNSNFYAKHLRQYGLLGDPATNIALPEEPDLHVAPNLISIAPTAPTPSDELTVSVELQNRGLIPSDSVDVLLTWERPDGSTARRTRTLQRFRLQKSLRFSFSLDERALGTNTFRITVDPESDYGEVNETNNTAERSQVVFDTGVSLFSPAPFGTVPSTQPSLQFFVSRQTTEPVPVTLQVDSVPSFSSPFRQQTQRDVGDLQGSWQPPALDENATYYWRARTSDTDENAWQTRSFTVAPSLSKPSWLQQNRLFQSNGTTRLLRTDRRWELQKFPRAVLMRSNLGNAERVNGFIIDGVRSYEYLRLGFGVLVMNGTTGDVRESKSFPTYDLPDRFENDSEVGDQQEAIDSLAAFLDRVPREGDYVFVRTRHLARQSAASIDEEVKSLFRNLGTTETTSYSTAIDTLMYTDLWTMKARKGYPEATVERVEPDTNQMGQEERLRFPYPSGRTTTPRIGPAGAWSSLSWTASTPDPSDSLRIEVLAADSTVLIGDLSNPSGQESLAQIDATAHPYLRLRATLADSARRTPPQLTRWSVSYEDVPELVADPAGLNSVPDTLRQGEPASVSLPIANLGSVTSSPIRIQYRVTDASNATTTVARDTLAALAPDTRDTSGVRFPTKDLPGENVLTAEVSTDGPPERISNNNTVVRTFFVHPDQTAPSLTIFANGREVPPTPESIRLDDPNVPFVSTEPSFEISLRDDNPNLVLSDTSYLDVSLKEGPPSDASDPVSDFRRIPFASNQLTLLPSDSSSPGAMRARFEPTLSNPDSLYTIKVEATDTQGNSVEPPFQGSFRVQQDQVIKDVYPYPNPMSTHTTFAFRVEGGQNEMLQNFRLRIYTLAGRLVRELDETNLDSPLSVGWNTLTWNGRDEDGDRVATGVYLYRVRIEGDEQTFRGDIEKVTVIR